MDKKFGMVIICTAILFLCFVGTASATTWSVDGSGGADFTRIQDAINNAKDGDTILVYSCIYYENVVVDKSVTLKGKGQAVVDANGSDSAITLTADGITLLGFNATNSGSSRSDVGIKVTSNNNTLTGNNVSSNNRYGIRLDDSSNNTITGNNVCSNNWYGISLDNSSNNTITGNNVCNNNRGIHFSSYSNNNTITGNDVSNNNYDGIRLYYSSNNTITGNNVCNNNWGGINWGGIDLSSSSNNTITGNNVRNNDKGISLSSSSNNTITGNNVCNNSGNDIDLYSYSNNNTITGNTFVSGGLSVRGSYQNTVEDNTVNGKPLVYLEDVSNYKIEDAGQVILLNCNNVTVEDLDLSNTSVGIELWNTEDSTISNNNVRNNSGGGIDLESSSNNNTITGNNVRNNKGEGIDLKSSCNNNIITGNNVSNNNKGIRLSYSRNNTITGNNVRNNRYGINLYSSSDNNAITGNNVCNNNDEGIRLSSSSNNTITGNNVRNNKDEGIRLYDSSNNNTLTGNTFVSGGLSIRSSFQNTVEDNTVNGKPLVYLKDVSNYKIEDAGQVILVNCSNIRVKNLDLSNTSVGIYLWETKDCIVSNNTVCNNSGGGIDLKSSSNNNTITGNNVCSNNEEGIDLSYSSNNTITGNNVYNNNGDGISLSSSSDNNAITGNNVYNNNWDGIRLYSSSNNTITGNNVCNNNDEGIDLDDSSNNTITGNNVSNNDDYFNLWYYSSNNIFYCNNFINNTDNFSEWEGKTEEIDEENVKEGLRVVIEGVKEAVKEGQESLGFSYGNWGSTNTWNSTEKITYTYNGSTYTNYLGNYWSDYEEKYPDAEAIDTTGIWDTPYSIDGAKDNYPLMERFENYGIICSPIVHPPAAEPIIAPGDNFTEFYILGPNETASDYPTNLTVGEDGKVIIGIVNHEYTNVTYQLEVWLSGELIGGNSIELKHNETWESPFTFRVTKAGRQKLEFLLFKDGLKEPYRDLHLWVDVK